MNSFVRARTTMVIVGVSSLIAALVILPLGCSSSSSGGAQGDPASEAFTNALEFGVPSTAHTGQMPQGGETGPQVLPIPGSTPTTVLPGGTLTISVPWQGGAVGSVNLSFGGSQYFNVPVPAAGQQTSGQAQIPAKVGASLCTNLASTCHQIQCYEEVVAPDGSVFSKASAQQIVLDCTGGKGCGGVTPTDAGKPDTSTKSGPCAASPGNDTACTSAKLQATAHDCGPKANAGTAVTPDPKCDPLPSNSNVYCCSY